LDSVLAQTYEEWECIVVDDFSKDDTKAVVEQYVVKDKRFRYVLNERTKGACGARNTGILHAKGEYVSFLDSDDAYVPETLQRQQEAFVVNPNAGMVYSRLTVYEDGVGMYPFGGNFGLQGRIYKEVLSQGYLAPTDVVSARREYLEAVGLFDESLPASQDDDLCFKLAKAYEVGFIDKSLAQFNLDADNRITNYERPAMGWWMLWNKYEQDVLTLCGKQTMAAHYKQCIGWFIKAQKPWLALKAMMKVAKYGWNLTFKQWIGVIAFVVTAGKSAKVNRKVQKWFYFYILDLRFNI
jgi:glycosyltransferase involved in cell wall biosynthesis